MRDNISSRAALRLPTQQANDMELGTVKAAAGVDATKFAERDHGAVVLLADDLSGVGASENIMIRAAKVDVGPTRAAAEASRERRLELDLLTGDAAGQAPAAPVEYTVLAALALSGADDHQEPHDRPELGEPEPVDAELVQELPDVLALLTEVIGEDETGIVATADLADRIGWDAKSLGEALWRLEIPSPRSPGQRVDGGKNPVSVQGIDAIIAAIVSYSDDA